MSLSYVFCPLKCYNFHDVTNIQILISRKVIWKIFWHIKFSFLYYSLEMLMKIIHYRKPGKTKTKITTDGSLSRIKKRKQIKLSIPRVTRLINKGTLNKFARVFQLFIFWRTVSLLDLLSRKTLLGISKTRLLEYLQYNFCKSTI